MKQLPFSQSSKIAVIGAGAAGIHMATELKKKGFNNITIFEKNNRIGGKTYSYVDKGIAHELGTTGFSVSRSAPLKQFLFDIFPEGSEKMHKIRMFDMVKNAWCKEGTSFLKKAIFFYRFSKCRKRFNEIFKALKAKGFPYQMDKIDKEILETLSLSMKDFLKKHNLSFLYKGLNNRFVAYGYGNLDEIPAYYGILLMQHNFIVPNTYYFFSSGNDSLWKKAAEQYNLSVELGAKVSNINHSLYELEKTVQLTIEQNGQEREETFDFVILTTPYLFTNQLPNEAKKAFQHIKSFQYAASIVELDKRKDSQSYHTFEFPKKTTGKFNNDVVVLINSGKIYEVATENQPETQRLHTCLQLTQPNLKDQVIEKIPSEVNRNFSRTNGIQGIHKQHLWKHYFPHISSEGIAKGAMQAIHDAQGKDGLWYIGSSVAGELTTLVTEFNEQLLNSFQMDNTTTTVQQFEQHM